MTDPQQSAGDMIKSAVQQSLTDKSWISLDSVAIATKLYHTTVGVKNAYVYLSLWGTDWVLTAEYTSQCRNILEALRLSFPETTGTEAVRQLAVSFSDTVDLMIAFSYAARLGRDEPQMKPFALGQAVATPGALALLERTLVDAGHLLSRHARGDWGDIGEEDKAQNNVALEEGGMLLSVYRISDQDKVWVITDPDRSVTTVLLPDEY